MPREKLILNGTTWTLVTKHRLQDSKTYLVRRRKKRKKDFLRMVYLLQRELDQHLKNLNTSETNQISPSLVINNLQEQPQSNLRLTIVAQLVQLVQHQLRKRTKTNSKDYKKQKNQKGKKENHTTRNRDLIEEMMIESLKEELLDKNNQSLKRKKLNQKRNQSLTLVV